MSLESESKMISKGISGDPVSQVEMEIVLDTLDICGWDVVE
jgi:hypothetical protein